jgi:uncharacterized protein (TIGR02300 family)
MPAKDFGTKHTCFKCAAKFYDMKKPDPVCPKCGADQREQAAVKPEGRRSRLSAAPKVIEPVEPATPEKSEEDEELDEFGEEEVEEEDEA